MMKRVYEKQTRRTTIERETLTMRSLVLVHAQTAKRVCNFGVDTLVHTPHSLACIIRNATRAKKWQEPKVPPSLGSDFRVRSGPYISVGLASKIEHCQKPTWLRDFVKLET